MATPASAEQVANLKLGGRNLQSNEWVTLVEDTLTKNVSGLLDRFGSELASEFEKLAPVGATGNLASGISVLGVEQKEDGLYRMEIGFASIYADYIDKGVEGIAPSKSKTILKNREGRKYKFKKYGMPESAINQIKDWMRAKNIQIAAKEKLKASKSGKKYKAKKNRFRETDAGARNLAYLIKKNGIAARNFQAKAFKNVQPKYQKELESIGFNSLLIKIVK